MVFKFSPSALLVIACIYCSSQAHGQNSETCAEAEISRCYLNFTRTLLDGAFKLDPRTTGMFSKDKGDKVCGAVNPVSPCEQPFMNCTTEANQRELRENAFGAILDIFCTTDKRNAFENASRCIANQPGFHNCTNATAGAPPGESSLDSELAVITGRLSCIGRLSLMCPDPGTAVLLSVMRNICDLLGFHDPKALTPDHEPVTSASGMNTRGTNYDPVVSSACPAALSVSIRTYWVVVYAVVVVATAILRN